MGDILSAVGALQLLPENASRATRLEALAHCAASNAPNADSQVSTGKLRSICQHPSLESIAHAEDPAESQFAEEFAFFGGSYLVLPGIAQAGEYMLSNLCKAIFLDPRKSLPRDFTSEAFRLVSSALHVLDVVTRRAGIRRGTAPDSSRYESIVIPDAVKLGKLKKCVALTDEEISSVLRAADLPPDSLEPLTIRAGDVTLDDYDVANGPLLWRPFVKCNGTTVLVIPGMVVSAIRQALLRLAYEANLQSTVAESYNKAVWQNLEESFGFTRNVPFPRRPSTPLTLPNASDGFFSLDHDKVLYCLLITDPLIRPATSDPFGLWTEPALSDLIQGRLAEVEKDVLGANPAPNDLFMVVIFQGLGGSAAFGLDRPPADSQSIALSAEALRTISLLEGGDPLALFNFARARDQARERCHITSTNILDEFYLYRKNDYSFYFSDQGPPNFILIPPGDSLNLQMEIARQRDFHAAKTPDGSTVEVTSLHSTVTIPIYSPVADLGERVRLLVEGLPVRIWITGPVDSTEPEHHRIYALFADAISFWVWQFTPTLTPLLSSLKDDQPIEIRMNLPAQEIWHFPRQGSSRQETEAVETKVDASQRLVEVTVREHSIPLFQTADNGGERELMRQILKALSQIVVPQSSPHSLTETAIDTALEKTAPLGMKKMLLFFDAGRTPEIDDRGIPRFRPLQKAWINGQLDALGQHLIVDSELKVGEIRAEQRTSILNQVALTCFSRLQGIIATLSPKGLLRFMVAYSESVHREQAMNRLTIPTRLECFRSDPDMIEHLGKRIPELANVGLASRFLVEFVVAQPPVGLRPMSLDLYDELRAWSYHCLNYAMLSDAVHFGIEEYKLSLLPSERLGIDGSARRSAVTGHMRAFALDQIGAAPENFKRQWEPTAPTPQGEGFREELNAASEEEFGLPLSELLELMEFGISFGQSTRGLASVPQDVFVHKASTTMKRSEDRVRLALDLLSLSARPSFWTPPTGFVKADLYPWRYNRPLSYMRRPFLHRTREGVPEVIWGIRHLRAAQRFLVDQCTSGRLKARTARMRSFMSGLLNAQGEAFNHKVSEFFRNLEELRVESRVKKIGNLRELQDHLGDIDVLVGDIRRHRILVIECKDLSAARTPYEMANEFNELFVGSQGRKSIVAKHQARASWVEANREAVVAFLKLAPEKGWRVVPLIVVDQPLVASYVRKSPIQVLSFAEIRRFWPDLRRI